VLHVLSSLATHLMHDSDRNTPRMTQRWPRTIVHADMDAFYASVEQRDDPALRGKPILVGPKSGRGVVLTASYEARPYRVGSAMPMAEALRRCPHAIVVPPRFELYRETSRTIMATFREFAARVEALSLDEAFLDMSGAEAFFGAPAAMAQKIKDAVREATHGLTVSVGVSGTKYVAKVASGYQKPDGLTIVPQAQARAWLGALPVAKLWGAGKKTQQRLIEAGFVTIGDVAAADLADLRRLFGKQGEQFHRLANADDPREVVSDRPSQSISWERTFERDIGKADEIAFQLRKGADHVAARLRREGYATRGVRLKLKTSGFEILTRQLQLANATQAGETLFQAVVRLVPELLPRGPFRLIGVGAYALETAGQSQQLGLLEDAATEKHSKLEKALDALEARFGSGVVHRAGDLLRTQDLGVAFRPDEGEE
jgi:DNA polymerase-4